uniref:Uncharacterized protein n=1 Tax=Plectus sambesii TaxID=2011161 RepID=A0A914W727_9BILA
MEGKQGRNYRLEGRKEEERSEQQNDLSIERQDASRVLTVAHRLPFLAMRGARLVFVRIFNRICPCLQCVVLPKLSKATITSENMVTIEEDAFVDSSATSSTPRHKNSFRFVITARPKRKRATSDSVYEDTLRRSHLMSLKRM